MREIDGLAIEDDAEERVEDEIDLENINEAEIDEAREEALNDTRPRE